MRKLLDAFYDEEIQRLSGLPKFPEVPKAQHEMRRALRRVSETDQAFIHRLISDVIDTDERCPTPAELIRRAGELRQQSGPRSLGDPDCEVCQGSGWVSVTRPVSIGGLHEYEADFSRPCRCRIARAS